VGGGGGGGGGWVWGWGGGGGGGGGGGWRFFGVHILERKRDGGALQGIPLSALVEFSKRNSLQKPYQSSNKAMEDTKTGSCVGGL